MLGRVSNDALPRLYGCADLSAMVCRSRWGGLEQEGFGIVFAESASCGVPQIAGASGGAAEAVEDGVTGVVLHDPRDARALADAISDLLDDDPRRTTMGVASRQRALDEFNYDVLAARLAQAISA
jgi:phosphatidylinositol alpha-1,6-mannosyltransferase